MPEATGARSVSERLGGKEETILTPVVTDGGEGRHHDCEKRGPCLDGSGGRHTKLRLKKVV